MRGFEENMRPSPLPHSNRAGAHNTGNSSARIESPEASNAETNGLIIGQNGGGCWVVRDRLGLKAGIFSSFGSALHFAKGEAEATGSGVTLSATVLELGLDL